MEWRTASGRNSDLFRFLCHRSDFWAGGGSPPQGSAAGRRAASLQRGHQGRGASVFPPDLTMRLAVPWDRAPSERHINRSIDRKLSMVLFSFFISVFSVFIFLFYSMSSKKIIRRCGDDLTQITTDCDCPALQSAETAGAAMVPVASRAKFRPAGPALWRRGTHGSCCRAPAQASALLFRPGVSFSRFPAPITCEHLQTS